MEAGSTPHDVACGQAILPHFQVVGMDRHLRYDAHPCLRTGACMPQHSCNGSVHPMALQLAGPPAG